MHGMKKWFLLSAAIACAGCGGSSTTDPGTSGTTSKVVKATVNGTAWTATTVSGAYISNALVVSGSSQNGQISINVANVTGPGTFQLQLGNPNSGGAIWIDGTGVYQSQTSGGSGTITLTTAVLGHIKGSFNFVGNYQASVGQPTKTVTITSGQFDITSP
jgi:ABC-type glycerol-3-phosphate transport system substrate-binding protein